MKKQTFDLAKIDVKSLKEFNGFEASQMALVKDNPFIKVTDNKSYEAAKKHAHALLKGRTTLESQEKLIVKTITQLRKDLGGATNILIDITRPAEMKQKTEIHAYEDRKEIERQKKIKEEAAALEELKNSIILIDVRITDEIQDMEYDTIKKVENSLETLNDIDGTIFKDVEHLFDDLCILLRERFNTKKRGLVVAFEQAKREAELKKKEAAFKKKEAARKKEEKARKEKDEADLLDARLKENEADITIRQNKHIIMLLKAGYKEGSGAVWTKAGNRIALCVMVADERGFRSYNVDDSEIEEFIAYGQKVELRFETLTPFKDLLGDGLFGEILEYDDNAFQMEINGLIEKRDAPKQQFFIGSEEAEAAAQEKIDDLTADVKMEELKEMTVNGAEIVSDLVKEIFTPEEIAGTGTATGAPLKLSEKMIEVDMLSPDKENLLKCLDSFGLTYIPQEFDSIDAAAFMTIIYDQFEECQAKLKAQINEKF